MSSGAHGARLARLLRLLVDEGLVDPDAALDGRVTITDLSRSNSVGLVQVDGDPSFVVKGGTIAADGIDPVSAEAEAYRWLGASEATACLAPPPILVAARGLAIVTRPQAGAVSVHEALASATTSRERALISELGRILGILHRANAGPHDLAARRPWILEIPSGRLPVIAVDNAAASRVVENIAHCAPLSTTIARFGQSWKSRSPIHGDIKFDNVIVTPARMLMIDWELAGLGEPVWDLAGVVDGLLLPLCVAGEALAVDRTLVAGLAEPALSAHRSVVGAHLSPSLTELLTAVVVRLAQTATQLAAMSLDRPEAAEAAPRVLSAAINLATDIGRNTDLATGYLP